MACWEVFWGQVVLIISISMNQIHIGNAGEGKEKRQLEIYQVSNKVEKWRMACFSFGDSNCATGL